MAHVLNQNYVKCSKKRWQKRKKNANLKKQHTEQIEIKLEKWVREYVHKSNDGEKQEKNRHQSEGERERPNKTRRYIM